MDERPVVNASPLILLSRANWLHLLRLSGDTIVVPAAVADEVRARGLDDPIHRALEVTDWLTVEETGPIPAVVANWDLGPGESSVLSWALAHPGSEAILDDLAARRCARALGISVRGTLGLVLIAKQRGIIPAARPVVQELRQSGMYLSDTVVNQALKQVGE